MKKVDLNCPCCDTSIIKSYSSEAKLRAKLLKWDQNGMVAVCKSCDYEVPITPDLLKKVQESFVFEADVKKDL